MKATLAPRLWAHASLCVALVLLSLAAPLPAASDEDPVRWPEEQRAFYQDGAAQLFSREDRRALLELTVEERQRRIDAFLARDPIPETPENELTVGIEKRRRLVEEELLSPLDDRARLLFLHGNPDQRLVLDCAEAFVPLELWRYGGVEEIPLILYRPRPEDPFRLWISLDTKGALYTDEMRYWLQQVDELRGRVFGKRIDRRVCPEAEQVDIASGVDGLARPLDEPRDNRELLRWLAAPDDLAAWARTAAATPLSEPPPSLQVESPELFYPALEGQRMRVRMLLTVPAGAPLESWREEDKDHEEVRLKVEGIVEQGGSVFDEFRLRFVLPPPAGRPVALVLERPLRPGLAFLVRMRISDEVGGGESLRVVAIDVPREAQPLPEIPVPEGALVALGEELALKTTGGADSIILIPPDSEVVFGRWRAEAIVTGERISQVVFSVDGEAQLTRQAPPFTVELRLPSVPQQQVIGVEGRDSAGEIVAADEVTINQPRGELQVLIEEPERGAKLGARFRARAEVVVPDGRRVEAVDFLLNEELRERLEAPPWSVDLAMPEGDELVYLTVVAELDDGSRSEEVRFLRVPFALEEVEVQLVELYTTVTDGGGSPVLGLEAGDFEVFEDERPQKLARFELVEDLPLTIGVTIDTSGSMLASLGEAQRAAVGFLERVVTPRDRAFAVGFSSRPTLLMPRTVDVGAIAESLEQLQADGWTALHDAVVFSLYYFRGQRGRRALVLLSDGDDTTSEVPFREALEYARRSGVVIYTVGLENESLGMKARRKLEALARETGGRPFYISRAEELAAVYGEIERELRSQYLLAYSSDRPPTSGEFRNVEVKVNKRGLEARTISGYYP